MASIPGVPLGFPGEGFPPVPYPPVPREAYLDPPEPADEPPVPFPPEELNFGAGTAEPEPLDEVEPPLLEGVPAGLYDFPEAFEATGTGTLNGLFGAEAGFGTEGLSTPTGLREGLNIEGALTADGFAGAGFWTTGCF